MGWLIFAIILYSIFSEAGFGWGLVAGVLLHSAYIHAELDQSAIDGWLGRGDDVYTFELVCDRADNPCLKKHGLVLQNPAPKPYHPDNIKKWKEDWING